MGWVGGWGEEGGTGVKCGAAIFIVPNTEYKPGLYLLPTEVRCPRLPQPENGRHHSSGGGRHVLGTELLYTCDSGHVIVGQQVLVCEYDPESGDGVWNALPPTCSGECAARIPDTHTHNCVWHGAVTPSALHFK